MDHRFSPHNTHLDDPDRFSLLDPHLRQLKNQVLVHQFALLDELPRQMPGIYTVTGGRQIGKTTLLKQWMARLLGLGINPHSCIFLTGELIDDHHSLVRLISDVIGEVKDDSIFYLILDEVTYINGWDKGIKFLADSGQLENTILILTGSDMTIIKEARTRFPGRRGKAETVDFHLYPLSFRETVFLKNETQTEKLKAISRAGNGEIDQGIMQLLFDEFEQYLRHGGFLTAINDMAREGRILPATFATYSDWIRGDILKRGRQELFLREILEAVAKHYGSLITWNTLSKSLSIDHPKTIADYIALLESMDVVYVQAALREDKLTASPKKARKVMFSDPFIFHAVCAWLKTVKDPYGEQVESAVMVPESVSKLVEACVTTQYRRFFPTYYIKAQGEVDVAYIDAGQFFPVEVKWTEQLRPKDLKQIKKYPGGRILGKTFSRREIEGVSVEPLPLAIFNLQP